MAILSVISFFNPKQMFCAHVKSVHHLVLNKILGSHPHLARLSLSSRESSRHLKLRLEVWLQSQGFSGQDRNTILQDEWRKTYDVRSVHAGGDNGRRDTAYSNTGRTEVVCSALCNAYNGG